MAGGVFVSAALYLVANIMYETGGIKVDNFVSILYRQDFIIVFFAFLGFQKRRLKELKGLPVVAYEHRGKLTSEQLHEKYSTNRRRTN